MQLATPHPIGQQKYRNRRVVIIRVTMSERMIELQRAKLGLPPSGVTPVNPAQTATGNSSLDKNNPSYTKQPSPAEVAAASLLFEDAQIERFIDRLQRRDRKMIGTQNHHYNLVPYNSGPTVPIALSRRILQCQGVGFLDGTVASIVSASADRFLATVFQQSIACRDQRLKGAAMTRDGTKQRKRHMKDYDADNDDRIRRRVSIMKAREDIAKFTIETAEAVKRGGGISNAKGAFTTEKKKKKKLAKKGIANSSLTSGSGKLDPSMEALAMEESEEEYDSIDEHEEYYQENVNEIMRDRIKLKKSGNNEDDDADEDSDEEDDALLLKDVVRPLEAWDFHLNGKEAIESDDDDDSERNQDIQYGKNSMTNNSIAQEESQGKEKGRSDNDTLNHERHGTGESNQNDIEKKHGDIHSDGNKDGNAKKTVKLQ